MALIMKSLFEILMFASVIVFPLGMIHLVLFGFNWKPRNGGLFGESATTYVVWFASLAISAVILILVTIMSFLLASGFGALGVVDSFGPALILLFAVAILLMLPTTAMAAFLRRRSDAPAGKIFDEVPRITWQSAMKMAALVHVSTTIMSGGLIWALSDVHARLYGVN